MTERFARPSAALFDWDNTLVENWRTVRAALNVALADAGMPPMDLEQVMFQGRHSSQDIFPKLFGDNWRHARTIFYDHFSQNHLAGLSLMPGADALLDALSEVAIPISIVSNKNGTLLRREVEFLGWTNRFKSIVGAQDAAADKPDPAPVRLALEMAGIVPSGDIWFVGDTDIDMRTAVAAGCYPILIGPGPADPALLDGAQPALRCHNCGDLAEIVRRQWRTISVQ